MRAGNVLSVTSPYSAVVDPQDYMGHYTWDGYDHDGAINDFLNNARVYDPVSQHGCLPFQRGSSFRVLHHLIRQRMIAGAAEMIVVGRAFLIAIGRANTRNPCPRNPCARNPCLCPNRYAHPCNSNLIRRTRAQKPLAFQRHRTSPLLGWDGLFREPAQRGFVKVFGPRN